MTPFFSQVQKAKTALYKNGIPFEQKMIDVWVVHTCQQSSAIGARPPPVLSPATEQPPLDRAVRLRRQYNRYPTFAVSGHRTPVTLVGLTGGGRRSSKKEEPGAGDAPGSLPQEKAARLRTRREVGQQPAVANANKIVAIILIPGA